MVTAKMVTLRFQNAVSHCGISMSFIVNSSVCKLHYNTTTHYDSVFSVT